MEIKMETILFFDDWRLQNRDNMVRRLGKPKWVPEATLEDDLTEGTWNFPTVWYDKESGLWHGIYLGAAPHSVYEVPGHQNIFNRTQVLLYAQSSDGIHWEKPDLTKETKERSRLRPNQVFSGNISINPNIEGGPRIDGGPVYYDEHESDPERRLKYLYFFSGEMAPGEVYGAKSEQRIATSPDGIHWRVEDLTWGTRKLDSPIGMFYNKHRDSYVITNRPNTGDRRVTFIATKDFKNFTPRELVIHPDSEDPPLVQFYGMLVFPYEDMYIGLLWRLHTDPAEIDIVKIFGPMDCSLTYSYNGWVFNRAFHKPFIAPNERGEHGGGCIYVASMVCTDNEIRFYSGGSKAEHFRNQELKDAALMLHTLRKDGFVYLESYATRGRVITKALVFKKDDLRLNVSVPYGGVRAQILDEKGKPIEGFRYQDSIPFFGDEIEYKPQWKNGRSLKTVLGKPVYLEIEVTEGQLYAIRGEFDCVGEELIVQELA